MDIQINHRYLSCSTLIMGSFNEYHAGDIARFAKVFFQSAYEAEAEDEWTDSDGDTFPMLAGYEIKDYAFLVCSTSHEQQATEMMLDSLGVFQKTERVHKNKNNDHECTFWMAPVYKVLEELRKYDAEGYKKLGTNVQKTHDNW